MSDRPNELHSSLLENEYLISELKKKIRPRNQEMTRLGGES